MMKNKTIVLENKFTFIRSIIVKLLLLLICNLHFVFGQNTAPTLQDKNEITNLSTLCKVWGFLKYYHPNVAKGNFNWDEQLLTILPKIEKETNKEVLSKIYLDWIDSLGAIKECKSCKKANSKEYFEKNFDLSWTQNNNLFSEELSKKLNYIEQNRFQGKNFYVATNHHSNIEIRNEPIYEDFKFVDTNHRLLSLFKYWNMVEYFFPYKYMTDQKWDEVLIEMISKFIAAENTAEYHLAMLETVIKLDDSHANFYTYEIHDYFGRKYIPAYFNRIENKIVITGFYNDSIAKINDLKKGDIIEKVNGKDIMQILSDRKKFVNGSNDNTKFKNYNFTVFNGSTDFINLTIRRHDTIIEKKIQRNEYSRKTLVHLPILYSDKYKIMDGNIGYINLGNMGIKDVINVMSELKSTKGIVIDLRDYPYHCMPFMIARHFIQTKKEFAKFIEPDLSYPGKYIWKKTKFITPLKEYYKGKVILLVNEETQSAGEYSTMILQAGDNVTTIGSQTAGADGNISKIEFIGYKSFMSGLGVFYPDGTETQRKGIKVDIEVNRTIEGVQKGKDELMEKALEILKKQN